MRHIKTVRDALAAIERDCIVDEVDNSLPPRVIESLRKRAFEAPTYFKSHIRYERNREVWWFSH